MHLFIRSKNNLFSKSFLILISFLILYPIKLEAESNKRFTSNEKSLQDKINNKIAFQYVLGPGDKLLIGFRNLDEYSEVHTIGPTGEIYLPEIEELNIEGFSIKGLQKKLKKSYSNILYHPEFTIKVVSYRPVNAFVSGEVRYPGKYTISVNTDQSRDLELTDQRLNSRKGYEIEKNNINFPTLFDAIRASGGITENSDLTNIQVLRKRSNHLGGGYLKASLNILPEVIGGTGSESQNIKILDGDIIKIYKSKNSIAKQMRAAMQSNINPSKILVFLSGQTQQFGNKVMPNGSSLNQLISSSGGKKIFSGRIEFIRFKNNGLVDRRIFQYDPKEKEGDYMNPILIDGDIVHVQRSLIGYATEAISTITRPALGIFSLYTIVDK